MSRPAGSPFLASGAQPGRRAAAAGKFFYFFARNPLKSPDSAKLNQIKPSKSKPFCLVLFGFACTRLAPWLNPDGAGAEAMGGHAPASRRNVARGRFPDSAARFEHEAAFGLWSGDGHSTDEESLERRRFRASALRQSGGLAHRGDHPVLGLEEARHRFRLGRGRRAGLAAIVPVSADRRSVDRRRL